MNIIVECVFERQAAAAATFWFLFRAFVGMLSVRPKLCIHSWYVRVELGYKQTIAHERMSTRCKNMYESYSAPFTQCFAHYSMNFKHIAQNYSQKCCLMLKEILYENNVSLII